ncbi:MAG: hypothetical protein C3F17_20820 [Bradyrhizobiaceae bacterium]|nr:MAG: hypothetical protein C3F17_20820 [Bradyrhizobiaceae bacterium]
MHGTVAGGRIRLLYVTPPSEHFAGIERVVHEIAATLATDFGREFDVHVLHCKSYQELAATEIPYQLHVTPAGKLRDLLGVLRAFLRRHSFDIIVCPQVEPSMICWLAARLSGSRVLLVPHLHGNPRIEERQSLRSRALFMAFRWLVSRSVPEVFAVSPSLAAFAQRHLAPKRPVRFVPNPARVYDGIDTTARPVDAPVFLCIARLCEQKGQDVLLKAFARVREKVPSASLLLVGSGPDERKLRALAGELQLGDSVTFAGYQPDLERYFPLARIFVLPSRWDGFALVMLDALNFGLPLVVTNCDFGARDLVTDQRLGRVVRVDDADDLAAAMLASLADDRSDEIVRFRRQTAASYAPRKVTAKHARALREIVLASSSVRIPVQDRGGP